MPAALATFDGLTHFYADSAFLRNLASDWPQLTPAWPFDPSNELHFDQGSSHQICWPYSISMQFDPGWPLHDLWPQKCITLWSGVLPTKFGGHRALLSKLTHSQPQLTPTWPSTPAMHYALFRGSSHQIWWP